MNMNAKMTEVNGIGGSMFDGVATVCFSRKFRLAICLNSCMSAGGAGVSASVSAGPAAPDRLSSMMIASSPDTYACGPRAAPAASCAASASALPATPSSKSDSEPDRADASI